MNIFENLENLNVSEECFNDILNIVETKLKDRMTMGEFRKIAKDNIRKREKAYRKARNERLLPKEDLDRLRYRAKYAKLQSEGGNEYSKKNFSSNTAIANKNNILINRAIPDEMTVSQAQKVAKELSPTVTNDTLEGNLSHKSLLAIRAIGNPNIKK